MFLFMFVCFWWFWAHPPGVGKGPVAYRAGLLVVVWVLEVCVFWLWLVFFWVFGFVVGLTSLPKHKRHSNHSTPRGSSE